MFGRSPNNSLHDLLHRPRLSSWERFWRAPVVFLAQKLYLWRLNQISDDKPQAANAVSVVCISDTHNNQPQLPVGDILIHAGDLTQSGTFEELQAALNWIQSQSHPHKIVIAGNHDVLLDSTLDQGKSSSTTTPQASNATLRARLNWGDIIYLENTSTTIQVTISSPDHPSGDTITTNNTTSRTLKIFGSPHSPKQGNWAFQYPRSHNIWKDMPIPPDTDILITHCPPRCHLDLLSLGCIHLLKELWRVRPRLHVFGHIHAGYGVERVWFDRLQGAYERAVIAGGGVWNLVEVVRELVLGSLGRKTQGGTLLVNAAVVGGLRDEERQRAVKVWI